MRKIYKVENDFFNTRLDKWFKKVVFNAPQSLIEKNIRKGKIKVNNKKSKSSYRLKKDDHIYTFGIKFSPAKNKEIKRKYLPTVKDISNTSRIFIENNENFVVINKPAGISVQSGTKSSKNIIDILRSTNEFKNCKPFVVHRIDKETTGILIVAKNRKYAQLFTTLFRIRKIHKTYLGIVFGVPKKRKDVLIDNLFHYENNKKIITKAITHYQVIDSNQNYSLLKLTPTTGRKHQLRKQLLIHGFPILGDTKYRILPSYSNKNEILMLHAYKVSFSIAEIKYNFSAEPPVTFKKILNEKYLKNF